MSLRPVDEDASLYQVIWGGEEGRAPVYSTALRTCGGDKQSVRSATRQLLVGLKEIKIIEQRQLEISSFLPWYTLTEARSEGTPVRLASYTTKSPEGCILDLAVWSVAIDSDKGRSLSADEFSQVLRKYEAYLEDSLPNLLRGPA